jgi:hypothetical protein
VILAATRPAGRQVVHGGSDDLLEFSGPIYEEVDCWNAGVQRLTFSTGVVLEIEYGRVGDWWSISLVHPGGDPNDPATVPMVTLVPARELADRDATGDDEDGCPSYSDKAILDLPADATVEVVRL